MLYIYTYVKYSYVIKLYKIMQSNLCKFIAKSHVNAYVKIL